LFALHAIMQVHFIIINFELEIKDLSYVTTLTYFREAWCTIIPMSHHIDRALRLHNCFAMFNFVCFFPVFFSFFPFLDKPAAWTEAIFSAYFIPLFNAPPWMAMDVDR
jgi:hypothetical protein